MVMAIGKFIKSVNVEILSIIVEYFTKTTTEFSLCPKVASFRILLNSEMLHIEFGFAYVSKENIKLKFFIS